MEPNHDYKRRSTAVRVGARSHLAKIRQERLARRADPVTAAEPEPDSASVAPEYATPEPIASDVETGSAHPNAGAVPELTLEDPSPEPTEVEPDPPVAVDVIADDGTTEVSAPPAPGEAPAESVHVEPATPDVPAIAPTASMHLAPTESDLFTLPGAGSGLVWMLQTVGIRTLCDLADADPVRLTADLGLIGQILNIRDWIAFAKEQTGPAAG